MKNALVWLAVACALLFAVLLGTLIGLQRTATQLEAARERAGQLLTSSRQLQQDSGWSLAVLTNSFTSVEPTADAAIVGVYRARLVGANPDGTLTFDWLGYVPGPHGVRRTNTSRHVQRLSAGPFSGIALAKPQNDVSPVPLVWVEFPDTLESLRSRDATGQMMLGSDWWVTVQGDHWGQLLQAP